MVNISFRAVQANTKLTDYTELKQTVVNNKFNNIPDKLKSKENCNSVNCSLTLYL
ncbi:hypothetical protein GOV04_04365 [Candidatus Woesearchaeota archaeon]|nr:hypothetical protein [Candidatus Woesearchaeota archaeon]